LVLPSAEIARIERSAGALAPLPLQEIIAVDVAIAVEISRSPPAQRLEHAVVSRLRRIVLVEQQRPFPFAEPRVLVVHAPGLEPAAFVVSQPDFRHTSIRLALPSERLVARADRHVQLGDEVL